MQSVGNYLLQDVIGKGGSAIVRVGEHKPTGERIAMKIYEKKEAEADGRHVPTRDEIEHELRIMRAIDHPDAPVARIYEILETKNRIRIAMDCFDRGDLFRYCVMSGLPKEDEVRRIFIQMVAAVRYLHSRGILHRDIKAGNFLMASDGSVRLSDFALALFIEPDTVVRSPFLSPPYAAPEMLNQRPYTGFKVDVWSMGCILYFMLVGNFPFGSECATQKQMQEMFARIQAGKYPVPDRFPAGARDLLEHMLEVDPAKRYSMDQVQYHSYLVSTGIPVPSFPIPGQRGDEIDNAIVAVLSKDFGLGSEESIRNHIETKSFSHVYGSYQLLLKRERATGKQGSQ